MYHNEARAEQLKFKSARVLSGMCRKLFPPNHAKKTGPLCKEHYMQVLREVTSFHLSPISILAPKKIDLRR